MKGASAGCRERVGGAEVFHVCADACAFFYMHRMEIGKWKMAMTEVLSEIFGAWAWAWNL